MIIKIYFRSIQLMRLWSADGCKIFVGVENGECSKQAVAGEEEKRLQKSFTFR